MRTMTVASALRRPPCPAPLAVFGETGPVDSRRARLALPGVMTAAHQALELGFGSGVIGQRHVGLAPAVALAVLADAGEVALALDRRRWDRTLAMAAGTAVAASALHFTLFPWRLRFGVPVLEEAEGLQGGRLAGYVVVLYAWGAAGAAAGLAIPSGRRRWMLPLRKQPTSAPRRRAAAPASATGADRKTSVPRWLAAASTLSASGFSKCRSR